VTVVDLAALSALVQVVFVNVALSADNAVVIGIATIGLPARQRGRALWLGIGFATVLRVGFAIVATSLLKILGLLLAGGILLLWVSWKLWREIGGSRAGHAPDCGAPKTLRRALWQIVVADVSMSLDNVLAVAAAAREHPLVLLVGLGISVVLMALASSMVARLIERHRWIAYAGLAVIVYIAGNMIWHGAHEVGAAIGGRSG
jgi:YjbE family integral membrane protein